MHAIVPILFSAKKFDLQTQKFSRGHIYMKSFLRSHGFKGVNMARRSSSCLFQRESVYPLHIAAQQGDYELATWILHVYDVYDEPLKFVLMHTFHI